LAKPFEDVEGVVTLASCTADQRSQIWDDKQQSLFSFWLVQALKGHADQDGDSRVDIDELYKYVSRTVRHAAQVRFPLAQSPVRVVRSGTVGVPVVVRLRPQSLKSLLADMAESLALTLEERQLSQIGVLEFTNYTGQGQTLRANFGLLGRYCADELERHLRDHGTGRYSVMDGARLQRALSEQGFTVADLASGEAVQQLSRRLNGLPVLTLGALQGRAGRQVSMQCKLLECDSGESAGIVGGTAQLTESEWAMLGRSVAVKPEDYRPEFAPEGGPIRQLPDQVIQRLDDRSEGPHPMLDERFAFRVRLIINGKERKGVFRGNDYIVPVNPGETYILEIENRDPNRDLVLLRLLVDGLNTKPEPVTKGVRSKAWAQRVSLEEAQPWKMERGKGERRPGGEVFAVTGFYKHIDGANSEVHDFVVADEAQTLAAQQNFTDQIGLITAAFYARGGATRRVGTGAGKLRRDEVRTIEDVPVGNLLGVIHIRYVDAKELGVR
jgi:hypothetical protein